MRTYDHHHEHRLITKTLNLGFTEEGKKRMREFVAAQKSSKQSPTIQPPAMIVKATAPTDGQTTVKKEEKDNDSDDDIIFVTSRPCDRVGFRKTTPTIKTEPGMSARSTSMSPLTDAGDMFDDSSDHAPPAPRRARNRHPGGQDLRTNSRPDTITSRTEPARKRRTILQSSNNNRNSTVAEPPTRRPKVTYGGMKDGDNTQSQRGRGVRVSNTYQKAAPSFQNNGRRGFSALETGGFPSASGFPTLLGEDSNVGYGHSARASAYEMGNMGQPAYRPHPFQQQEGGPSTGRTNVYLGNSTINPNVLSRQAHALNTPRSTPTTSSSNYQATQSLAATRSFSQLNTTDPISREEYIDKVMELDLEASRLAFERKRLALVARKAGFNTGEQAGRE